MYIKTHSKTSYFLCLKEEFYTKQIYLLTIQLNWPHALKMFFKLLLFESETTISPNSCITSSKSNDTMQGI